MDNLNTTNIQNCGIYTGAGANVTAKRIKITINHSVPGTSTATSKKPFRFNIPTPTRHFKGRKETMQAVRNHLITLPAEPVDCWERIVAIVGLGGMGKTETAYKFAAEFKETFKNVAWINAETEGSALASFLGLAKHLKIVSNDQKEADLELVREIYQYLDQEDNGRVLFIFDNVVRLHLDEEEFGIMEYLPTDDLPNQRFPYVLITTQTHDWERRVKTFQIDELTEMESLEFFRSCFQIDSAECDDLFKKLHELLEGYPLVMNLAASQLDYIPKRHSVPQLQQQIHNYIDKLEKENKKILNEKFNRIWPTKYNKTLSNVWQLTFERIQEEESGHDALDLLQLMSYLHVPIDSDDVAELLFGNSDCPYPPFTESQFRLKELIRILERFYTLRVLEVIHDDEEEFRCELGIHRLVQFVVRQQMDSSKVLERLSYFLSIFPNDNNVNQSALEEALRTTPVSQQTLPYVGLLACGGFPAAREIVETRRPETKAAATIWRLYFLERGMTTLDENATQVLRELVELTKSEERLADRNFFGNIATDLLIDEGYCGHKRDNGIETPGYFDLGSLDGIEELVAQLILNVCSLQDSRSKSHCCESDWEKRDLILARLTAKLSKTFVQADAQYSMSTVHVIADTWLALFARLKYNYLHNNEFLPYFLEHVWEDMHEAFHSPNASKPRIGALKTCLWDRGLAKELIELFGFISHYFDRVDFKYLSVLRIMEFSIDGMDLRDKRVQEVISSICQIAATIETEFISKDYSNVQFDYCIGFTVYFCGFWVKLFLMSEDAPLHEFLDSISQLKFLVWMEGSPKLNSWKDSYFGCSMSEVPYEFKSKHFPQFIERFSSSDIRPIKTLVNVIRRLMEDYEF